MTSLFDSLPHDNLGPREGDRLRDRALDLFRTRRPVLVRRLMRVFLNYVLIYGPATSDALRLLVPIPPGTDPRVVGSAVRALAELRLIHSIGRRKSRRPEAHARKLDLWAIRDDAAARQWLLIHPELGPTDGEVVALG
jgi:hypothetical protein